MQDFSINDVLFRRTAGNRCLIIVHGQTVGDVERLADPHDPHEPGCFRYRIDLHDAANGPCFVHHRSQVRLAIADRLWNDDLAPTPVPPGIATARAQPALPHIR